MRVKEIFYSLQGEGQRAGEASIFIRLAGCNLKCSFCDTNWKGGKEMSLDAILKEIKEYSCKVIVWTGGEPALQLTNEIIAFFKKKGYYQCIETNGTIKLPKGLDYIVCSPKSENIILKEVTEIRIPIKAGVEIFKKLPKADYYYLSPITSLTTNAIIRENLDYCINYIKKNNKFRLSVQMHKRWKIL